MRLYPITRPQPRGRLPKKSLEAYTQYLADIVLKEQERGAVWVLMKEIRP